MTLIKHLTFFGLCLMLTSHLIGCKSSGGTVVEDGEETNVRTQQSGDPLAETHVRLGIGYMQKGNHELALRKFRKALAIDDNIANGHFAIALLYERLNRPKTAEQHYIRALEINPQYSEAQNAYGVYLCRDGRYAEAEPHFQSALKNPLYQTPHLVHINGGVCANKAGNYDQAEEYFRKALKRNAKQPVALYGMSLLNFSKGNNLRARAYLQRYSAIAKHTSESLWLGIRLEKALGDANAQSRYASLLKRKFPDSKEASLLSDSERDG